MLREGAERFLQKSYPFERRRATLAVESRCDRSVWQEFVDLGWLALNVPEEAGGLGGGPFEAAIVAEEMGRRLVLEPYATTALLCTRLVERSPASPLRDELLTGIADGSLRLALAALEPGRGYDVEHALTLARADAEGHVVNGVKLLVQDAPAANRFIVVAATDRGPGLFVIGADAAGLALRAYPLIDGRLAADIDLVDVRIPAAALLCDSTAALDEALDRLRTFEVAEALGAMEAVMALTAEHLRNRRQFGQPLANFQALQHRMAEMFVEVQETRSALYHALANLEAEPLRRNAAVSSAKVVAAEAGRVVGGHGIQLHGGVGMTDDYQVGHYFKRLLVLEKSWGDVDFHLDRIARVYR